MAEPTLQQIFGAGSTQTSTSLSIAKADYPALSADAANRAEQMFVAIFIKALSVLTEENQATNTEQSITITKSFSPESLVTRNDKQYRQLQFIVNFQKEEVGIELDPNDY